MSHISNNSIEPTKSNFVENSINIIQRTSLILSDLSHPVYSSQNRDAQAEYSTTVKTVLGNYVKDINFTDPVQMRRVHGDLMN